MRLDERDSNDDGLFTPDSPVSSAPGYVATADGLRGV
jgi:hypothetical protein